VNLLRICCGFVRNFARTAKVNHRVGVAIGSTNAIVYAYVGVVHGPVSTCRSGLDTSRVRGTAGATGPPAPRERTASTSRNVRRVTPAYSTISTVWSLRGRPSVTAEPLQFAAEPLPRPGPPSISSPSSPASSEFCASSPSCPTSCGVAHEAVSPIQTDTFCRN